MISYALRLFKRLIVLVPGVIGAYIAYRGVYPFLDLRLHEALALLLSYMLAAYIIIPVFFRITRLFFKPRHIPLYCTTPDGFACDPINIGVVGSYRELASAMTAAGWFQADKRTFKTLLRLVLGIVLRRPYPTAPFSSLFLFGRKQDVGFQKPVDASPRNRHHVRFWAVVDAFDPEHQRHISFWRRLHPVAKGRLLWLGAASQDIGLGLIRHNLQLTHMIHPDTDAERDLIATNLESTDKLAKVSVAKAGKPYELQNRVLGGYLVADGDLKICELK